MLSSFSRSSAVARTPMARAIAARGFALGDSLNKKERVEEERYVREQEKMFIEKKRAEAASSHDIKEYEDHIAPAMAEIQSVLKTSTNESISEAGLEALARWKVGK